MNPDLSLLAAYPGEYQQALISELYNALRLEQEGIRVIPGVKNKLNTHKFTVEDGVKPYTGKFVSKDDLQFVPRVLEVFKAQRDLSVEPSKYIPTYMAAMRGRGENANNMTIPFEQFTWEAVMKRVGTEVNLQSVFHGVGVDAFVAFDAGATYAVGDFVKFTQNNEVRYFECVSATSAGQSPDTHAAKWKWAGAKALTKGFGKIIKDEITAGNLTVVGTGAVTNTNAYTKFTQMYRSLPEPIKMGLEGQALIYCSMTDYENLVDAYETDVKKNFEESNGVTYLAKTDRKCAIKPVSWLAGSRRLIATVEGNLWAGTDELSDMNLIKVKEQMYSVDAGITFMLGFQISDLDVIKVSDQA